MTGPRYTSRSSGLPILIFFVFSTSRRTNSSRIGLVTYTREHAEHFCPCAPKADRITPSVALSRSADGITSAGFLPPISMMSGRGTGLAALSRIRRMPTSFDPVKTMPSTSALSMSSWPAVPPPPVMKLKTPGGMPAAAIISYSL